jgi:chromosome partitioning protein
VKIISLINPKGGTGKTTLAINLARYVQLYKCIELQNDKSKKVLLIDADTQGSMRDWHDAGEKAYLDIMICNKKSDLLDLERILQKSNYGYVFIDTPGSLNEIIGAAICISDFVLIPLQPSPYDVWATQDIVNILNTRYAVLGTNLPKAAYILNGCVKGTKAEKEVREHLNKSTIVPMYQNIYQRIDYAVSAAGGITIFETNNKNAIEEISLLGAQLLEMVGE